MVTPSAGSSLGGFATSPNEDLGDVTEALFEAERDAISVLVA